MKRLTRKDLLLLANILIGKIPDTYDAKKSYQSSIGKKNSKSVRQSKAITYEPKNF